MRLPHPHLPFDARKRINVEILPYKLQKKCPRQRRTLMDKRQQRKDPAIKLRSARSVFCNIGRRVTSKS